MSLREPKHMEDLFQKRLLEHEVHEGRNLFPFIQQEIARKKRKKAFVKISYIAASLLIFSFIIVFLNREVTENPASPKLIASESSDRDTKKIEPASASDSKKTKEKVNILEGLPKLITKSNDDLNFKEVLLPDGSKVTLKLGAKLSYEGGFGKSNREVSLLGTAFFDVQRNEKIPFVVSSGNSKTTVLGTSFCINGSKEKDKIYVTSGLVEFSNIDGSRKVILEPGYKAMCSNGDLIEDVYDNNNFLAWKTGEMIFDEEKVQNVIPVLEGFFNKKIILENPSLLECSFSGNFNNPNLREFLSIFSLSLNLQYSIKGQEIIFTGKGCDNL